MNVMLCPVREDDRDTLWQLLQYSLFEESATDGNTMNNQALFDYPWFDHYFTDEDREAFLIRDEASGRLLGFVMINIHVQKVVKGHSIAEFLIIPKYRRLGVGRRLCSALTGTRGRGRFPLPWAASVQGCSGRRLWANIPRGTISSKTGFSPLFMHKNRAAALFEQQPLFLYIHSRRVGVLCHTRSPAEMAGGTASLLRP